jgi:hypothetical protein
MDVVKLRDYEALSPFEIKDFLARAASRAAGASAVACLHAGRGNLNRDDDAVVAARARGRVLLNGSGFEAPDWSVRVSFANLNDHVYDDIGRAVRAVARCYRRASETSKPRTTEPPTERQT